MRVVFGLVLIAGVALAGFAVYMANGYVNSYRHALSKAKAQAGVDTVQVFVAKETLKYGQKLEKSHVRLVKWPKTAIPEGTFIYNEGTTLFTDIEGQDRFVLRTIEKDEAIMEVKVTKPGQDAGITSRLERGMRAFAIKVDVASGVSGFLRPGDRVDVYWTGRVTPIGGESGRSQEVTKLIENSVQLIAVDQTADGHNSAATIARTVTVAARPEQVAALAQAQSTGRLSLALVGSNDDSEVGAVEVDQMSLLGLEAPEEKVVVEQKKEEVCTIRTRKGAEVIEIPIPCTN